jgi:fatty acid desaturase
MDGPFWQMPIRYPRVLQYARKRMVDDPRTAGQKTVDAAVPLCVLGIYALAWRQGALQDVLLLWFVPFVLAKVIMDWYVNYLPHVGLPPDRYRGTRIIDLPWLTPLLLNHNYHAIHHLWPNIPWYAYRATFLHERDHLESHGVPIETRLPGF